MKKLNGLIQIPIAICYLLFAIMPNLTFAAVEVTKTGANGTVTISTSADDRAKNKYIRTKDRLLKRERFEALKYDDGKCDAGYHWISSSEGCVKTTPTRTRTSTQ